MSSLGTNAFTDDPEIGPDGYRYNDDLLLDPDQRAVACQKHPFMAHVLDHAELLILFAEVDGQANRAKKCSRAWGFWAVVMSLLSLLGGSGASLWEHFKEPWPLIIAWTAAGLGLMSVLVAWVGLLYGPRKREWLRNRLLTERIRQYHFQTFLAHFAAVVASATEVRKGGTEAVQAVSSYQKARAGWFAEFTAQYKWRAGETGRDWRERVDAALERVIQSDPDHAPPIWIHRSGNKDNEPRYPPGEHDANALATVFRAYATFRFQEQLRFTQHTLRASNDPPRSRLTTTHPPLNPTTAPGSQFRMPVYKRAWGVVQNFVLMPWFPGRKQPLKVWRKGLDILWYAAFAVLIVLHLILLSSVIIRPMRANLGAWIHIVVLWAALVAVASRVLADGFALNRELERYEEYLAVCAELFREFQLPDTTPERKFDLMVRMEWAAFEEMRDFLRSHREATFVL